MCTGKLGQSGEENIAIPCYISGLEGITIVHISAGCEHSAAISDSGLLYTWGHGDGGRLGHGDHSQCLQPTAAEPFVNMKLRPFDVHCGDKFTVVLAHPHSSPSPTVQGNSSSAAPVPTSALGNVETTSGVAPSTQTDCSATSSAAKYSETWFSDGVDHFLKSETIGRNPAARIDDKDCIDELNTENTSKQDGGFDEGKTCGGTVAEDAQPAVTSCACVLKSVVCKL